MVSYLLSVPLLFLFVAISASFSSLSFGHVETMGLLLTPAHLHSENNSPQSAFYTDRFCNVSSWDKFEGVVIQPCLTRTKVHEGWPEFKFDSQHSFMLSISLYLVKALLSRFHFDSVKPQLFYLAV